MRFYTWAFCWWSERVNILLRPFSLWVNGFLFRGLAGCSVGQSEYLEGDLNGVNPHFGGINHFSVNGYGGANIAPYGYGGGSCCVMLSRVWRPGLKVSVEWELDSESYAKINRLKAGYGFDEEASAVHKAKYQKHSVVVNVVPYEEKLCSPEFHFLPCDQIKISTLCWACPSPNSPIEEPLKMKEPAVCPK